MSFGMQEEEIIDLAFRKASEASGKYSLGAGSNPISEGMVHAAIAAVVTENNARILEALTKAGIKLELE